MTNNGFTWLHVQYVALNLTRADSLMLQVPTWRQQKRRPTSCEGEGGLQLRLMGSANPAGPRRDLCHVQLQSAERAAHVYS